MVEPVRKAKGFGASREETVQIRSTAASAISRVTKRRALCGQEQRTLCYMPCDERMGYTPTYRNITGTVLYVTVLGQSFALTIWLNHKCDGHALLNSLSGLPYLCEYPVFLLLLLLLRPLQGSNRPPQGSNRPPRPPQGSNRPPLIRIGSFAICTPI